MRRWLSTLLLTPAAGLALWWWWRLHPTSRPFAQRVWVDFPHPFITHARLRRALDPRPGERMLEIGVGSGRYAVPLAGLVGSDGVVVGVDLHLDMLELARRRAVRDRAGTVLLLAADAVALPFPDASFDGVWLVSTLGQVPEPASALAEVYRVLRPGGRLVIGELGYDPHGVRFGALRRRAADIGFIVGTRLGGPAGYFAPLTVPD